MDLLTIVLILIALCLAVMGALAWSLHRMGEPILPAGLTLRPRHPPSADRLDAHAAPAPKPPAPVALDRADPTVRRYEEVLVALEQAEAAARAVPERFQERVAMAGELQAISHHLDTARTDLASAAPEARTAQGPLLGRLAGRLGSIQRDAEMIGANLDLLAVREQRLTAEALALDDNLAALERRGPLPRAVLPLAAAGAELLARVRQLPPRGALGSANALRYRLGEANELLAEVTRCRAGLAAALDPEAALRALLAEPLAPPRAPTSPQAATGADDEAAALERRLMRMAMGDRAKVDGLIALERAAAPQATRAELIRSAIERWERDLH